MTSEINSLSSNETVQLAEALGRRLKGGEIIELVSDLGGGKTTFTHGLAKGIGSNDHVSSPTFKICNVYTGTDFRLYHYDFYRLSEPGLVEYELMDAFDDPNAVLVIEWADVVEHVLPESRLTVQISNVSDEARKLTYIYPESLAYLVE